MNRIIKWWERLNPMAQFIILVLAAGTLIPLLVVIASGRDIVDVLLTIGSEMGSALVIFILFDYLLDVRERRAADLRKRHQMQDQLIRELGSRVGDISGRAAEQLRERGWLTDGTLERAHLNDADLEGIDLSGAALPYAYLGMANVQRANLSAADLRGVNFYHTRLEGADLRGCDLRGAKFVRARLRGADLTGANLTGAILNSIDADSTTILPDGSCWQSGDDFKRFVDTI